MYSTIDINAFRVHRDVVALNSENFIQFPGNLYRTSYELSRSLVLGLPLWHSVSRNENADSPSWRHLIMHPQPTILQQLEGFAHNLWVLFLLFCCIHLIHFFSMIPFVWDNYIDLVSVSSSLNLTMRATIYNKNNWLHQNMNLYNLTVRW